MGKQIILAEKPSVGKEFAKALNCKDKKDGYCEGSNVIITWAIGHLLETAPPEDYNPELKTWQLESLPIIPEKFKHNPVSKTLKQLRVVKSLLNRKDVDSLVIATDAGREGELIARLIINHAGLKKPMYRFWTSQALDQRIIQYGLQKGLKPASDYDRLYRAGYQRSVADWLVGMNLTRAATLKMGNTGVFSVGRVQTAVLSLLVDRRRHRENFKPEPYWLFKAHFMNEKGKWIGTWFKKTQGEKETRFWSKKDARKIALKVHGKKGEVTSATKKRKKTPPPQLYSLTMLQREANRAFGFTSQRTLDIAQALYEQHKVLSYPRTDSQVLGSGNVKMAQDLVSKLSASYNDLFKGVKRELISGSNKRVFNDAKLTDHHALIPLKAAENQLSQDEQRIYEMVLYRFAAVFYPDYEYEATEIITTVNEETFQTNGTITLKLGWKALYQGTSCKSEDTLPPLIKGDPANIEKLYGEEKQTKPMAEYNEDSLLGDMSNPAKYVEDSLKDIYRGEVGLGTQTTRSVIIDTLVKREYAQRKKTLIIATDKGCALINFLRKLPITSVLASPAETAKWEQKLNSIAFGEGDDKEFKNQINKFVIDSVNEFKTSTGMQAATEASAQASEYGKCPACGAGIIKGKKGFGCSNWRSGCKFTIWINICGATITKADAKTLLAGKVTREIEFESKNKGTKFKAALKLEQENGEWRAKFQFSNNPGQSRG